MKIVKLGHAFVGAKYFSIFDLLLKKVVYKQFLYHYYLLPINVVNLKVGGYFK